MVVDIELERFMLTSLKEHHVTDEYLAWFEDGETKKYIDYALEQRSKNDLKAFVRSKDARSDVLFLAIFDKINMKHIGNIKYEPIDSQAGTATMGILIGANDWRGKGVGPDVIKGSALWMKKNMGINKFYLGVDVGNLAAVRAYNKIGFKKIKKELAEPHNTAMMMEMSI
ncbi:GNAT family protein [Candidatus Njordibacter sp. Uisw_056]|jgi:RimJ/RimL family protein N-acetyltransferase|uniref:GNAT family N-acetyltransferase n=1 Tax=Candidatus Njordibacter sp. Uisw_056 TaxID=3230973 RepID=UPI003D484A7B